MKKIVCAAFAVAIGGAASAADLPRSTYYAPGPGPAGVYNWAGPYLGANVGYQWGSASNVPGTALEPAGIIGGVQAGYNWQSGVWVFGAETDLQVSGAEDTFAPWKFSNPWWGTLRGRAGYAWNSFMFYATGGLAYGDVEIQNLGFTETHTQLGWTLGGGVEVGLNDRWSAKAEYLYVDLGNQSFTVTGTKNGFSSNVLRVGVNYRF
jgi:outer membrane immunogenic protein